MLFLNNFDLFQNNSIINYEGVEDTQQEGEVEEEEADGTMMGLTSPAVADNQQQNMQFILHMDVKNNIFTFFCAHLISLVCKRW